MAGARVGLITFQVWKDASALFVVPGTTKNGAPEQLRHAVVPGDTQAFKCVQVLHRVWIQSARIPEIRTF